MIKVHILDRCKYCDGEAYVFVGEAVDYKGVLYPRYLPCSYCQGSGELAKWVSLKELADLLDRATSMEPDIAELARQQPINQRQDSREAAGI